MTGCRIWNQGSGLELRVQGRIMQNDRAALLAPNTNHHRSGQHNRCHTSKMRLSGQAPRRSRLSQGRDLHPLASSDQQDVLSIPFEPWSLQRLTRGHCSGIRADARRVTSCRATSARTSITLFRVHWIEINKEVCALWFDRALTLVKVRSACHMELAGSCRHLTVGIKERRRRQKTSQVAPTSGRT